MEWIFMKMYDTWVDVRTKMWISTSYCAVEVIEEIGRQRETVQELALMSSNTFIKFYDNTGHLIHETRSSVIPQIHSTVRFKPTDEYIVSNVEYEYLSNSILVRVFLQASE